MVGLIAGSGLQPEQQRLLDGFAWQLASALERARLAEVAQKARVAVERAAMRNTLLASISHDLRTPLSAIASAGSIVARSQFTLDVYSVTVSAPRDSAMRIISSGGRDRDPA